MKTLFSILCLLVSTVTSAQSTVDRVAWDYQSSTTVTRFVVCATWISPVEGEPSPPGTSPGCVDAPGGATARVYPVNHLPNGVYTFSLYACEVENCSIEAPVVTARIPANDPDPGQLPRPEAPTNFRFIPGIQEPPPTNDEIQAKFSKGQVFLTWKEAATAGLTYYVCRESTPVTSCNASNAIVAVPDDSGMNRYTNQRFIVTDMGQPLAADVGLYVYTSTQSGQFYYAVTSSQSSVIVPGQNATDVPVSETVWPVPGAVRIGGPVVVSTWNVYQYAAWESQATWRSEWGSPWHRFDVAVKAALSPGIQYPLVLDLHGAGNNNYQEPSAWVDIPDEGIFVFPVARTFTQGHTDPYSGANIQPNWFGHPASGTPKIAYDVTEKRLLRYLDFVNAIPEWQTDSNRIYVRGASMGGGGAMRFAMRNAEKIAAAETAIGYIGPSSWGDWNDFSGSPTVNLSDGPLWANWEDATWLVEHATTNLPPTVYTFRSGDGIIWPWAYPVHLAALETRKFSYAAKWIDGGHWVFWIGHENGDNWNFMRFKKNEAYPAFSSAATSDTPVWGTAPPLQPVNGQRNTFLDWSSSLHPFGSGDQIIDQFNLFAISFKSLTGSDTTATMTVRNAQAFKPGNQAQLFWENKVGTSTIQSGTLVLDGSALITISNLEIRAGGNRVTITCPACQNPQQ